MGTFSTNILPSNTGQDLGSPSQRWDAYIQTLNVESIGGVTYADQYSTIQLALDAAGVGGHVVIPTGTYTLTTALHPYDGQTIEGAASNILASEGVIIKPTGAIWAVENSSPTTGQLWSVKFKNIGFDLTNASCLGGIILRACKGWRGESLNFLFPSTGSKTGVLFDAQDVAYGCFWNEFTSCLMYGQGAGATDTHYGYRWINAANSNTVRGGAVFRINKAFSLESGGNNLVTAGAEDFTAGGIILGTDAKLNNVFLANRLESNNVGAQAIDIQLGAQYNAILFPEIVGMADAAHELADASVGSNEYHIQTPNQHKHVTRGYQYNTNPGDFRQYATDAGGTVGMVFQLDGNASTFRDMGGGWLFNNQGGTTEASITSVGKGTFNAGLATGSLATGTAPIITNSTTECTNLNAEMLQGRHLAVYVSTLTPALVAANTVAAQSVTVTGATTSWDILQVIKPTEQAGLAVIGARVTGANTVSLQFANCTAVGITPTASEVYRFVVVY